MWKWDISAVAEDSDSDGEYDNWSYGVFFRTDPTTMSTGPSGWKHYRSFYNPPAASLLDGELYLAFGSGERNDLHYAGADLKDYNNRFFEVRDPNPTGGSAFPGTLTESDLTPIGTGDYDTNSSDSGYYMVFPDGEKFVNDYLIFAGQVVATSFGGLCGAPGTSALYVFDLGTGLGYFTDSTTTGMDARRISLGGGLSNTPMITISAEGDQMYIQTQNNGIVQVDPPDRDTKIVDRIYWRQNF